MTINDQKPKWYTGTSKTFFKMLYMCGEFNIGIKSCLKAIREAEGKAIRFIRGYQGAWKAVRVRVE